MKAPDPYHGNGTLFSSGWEHISLTERGVNWFQLGRRKGGGKEKEREGGIKDIGKLPRGAGACLTAGCTSALHTLGKCGPAWAGPRDYGKTNQAYNGKHTEGRAVCVCVCVAHCPFMQWTNRSFQQSREHQEQDLRHFVDLKFCQLYSKHKKSDVI